MAFKRRGRDSEDSPEVYDFEREAEYEEARRLKEQVEREQAEARERDRKQQEEIHRLEEERRNAQKEQKKRDEELKAATANLRNLEKRRRESGIRNVEAALRAQNSDDPVATEVTTHDGEGVSSTETAERGVVPVLTNPEPESTEAAPESTETVVSPVIGSSPSLFFRTPWWEKKRPLRGLSVNGYASDVHCDSGVYGSLASVGATLRGLKHQVPDKNSGTASQNEDWFSLVSAQSSDGQKYVVSVVCDGLSSAQYSSYGARRASTLLARDVAEEISKLTNVSIETLNPVVQNSLASQAQSLMSWNSAEFGAPQASSLDVDPNQFGCTVTLVVVCAEADENGRHRYIAGNVGDSPVLQLSGGVWRKVSPPEIESGGILDTRTHAFPRHTQCDLVEDFLESGECLAATSDGVGNFIHRNGLTLALGQYLSTRWSSPVGIMTFLNQMNFDLPTADDDRTAVLFWAV
jgi:flagellar biosynthesis GTPase FlhF